MRYWMLTALLVGTLAYGCGKQGEGQRCDTENADADCDDGLSCVTRNSIQGAVCCPDSGATALACLDDIGTTSSSTSGTGGSGGTGGSASSTGGAGGTSSTGGAGGTGGTTSAGGAGGN